MNTKVPGGCFWLPSIRRKTPVEISFGDPVLPLHPAGFFIIRIKDLLRFAGSIRKSTINRHGKLGKIAKI